MRPSSAAQRQREQKRREFKSRTSQWRAWKGLNIVDDRTAIDDDELFRLENAITLGKGKIRVLPGPGATIATIAVGISSITGVALNGVWVLIAVNSDGSLSQVTTGGVVTAIAPAGTVTANARVAIWRGSPVLIVDPTFGYMQWDGAVFTVVDATKVGTTIDTFQGRVWIGNNRTITFTAPNTNNDFTAANGAGTTTLTDSAFAGNIVRLISVIEELWIIGQSAIDAISNVTATGVAPVITTFSITNIGADVGTNAPQSVRGYFRALALMAPFGAYALSGVTPQKLSDKLDDLFANLTLGSAPAAVGVVQNLLCLFFLVTYTGTDAQAQIAASSVAPIPMLLGFSKGNWFTAVQRTTLKWVTTAYVGGVAQVWGADTAGNIFQCFGAAANTNTLGKISSKLYDHGRFDQWKTMQKMGLAIRAVNAVANLVMTADTEESTTVVTLLLTNQYILLNAALGVLQLQNAALQNLNLVGTGLVLAEGDAPTGGHYLGWTITFNDPPFDLVSVDMEYVPSREHSQGKS